MNDRRPESDEQLEFFEAENEITLIAFEGTRCDTRQIRKERIGAARVLRDGRLGFASGGLESADGSARGRIHANARVSASFGEESALRFPAVSETQADHDSNTRWRARSIDELHAMGERLAREAQALEPGLKVRVDLHQERGHREIGHGGDAALSLAANWLYTSIFLQRFEEGDILGLWEIIFNSDTDPRPEQALDRLRRQLKLSKRIAPVTGGEMPVLFTPKGASALLVPLLSALNGQRIAEGNSPLCDRLGESVYDPRLTLHDDPTFPDRHHSETHDQEGTPRTRRVFIEAGVPRSAFHDLSTAALLDTRPTGHGFRDPDHRPPAPGYGNPTIAGGEKSVDTLIAGIDRGLMAHDVLGVGMNASANGDFNYPLQLAFLIEDGEIVGRVKNASIGGNVHELLAEVKEFSRETEVNHYNQETPHILLPAVKVVA